MSYIRQLLIQQALKRKSNRPKGLIGQYKPYLNSNDSPTRDILKDYSGRSHDIQLYNFGYALGSGYGSWAFDLGNINWDKLSYSKFRVNQDSIYASEIGIYNTVTLRFKISNFVGTKSGFTVRALEKDTYTMLYTKTYTADGIYTFTFSKEDSSEFRLYFYNKFPGSASGFSYDVEFLPDYPGALVSDGVDDYGLCENFPILTKEKGYTVVALRKWLNIDNSQGVLVTTEKDSARTGAFSMEYDSVNPLTYSFGAENKISSFKEDFTYQTSNKYNDESILSNGDFVQTDNLLLFRKRLNFSYYSSIALYALEIYDHDLTDEEIQRVKETMIKEYEEATNNKLEGV